MFNTQEVDERAILLGFKRRGKQNWARRTRDFVQLINLQNSAWSDDVNYLNFALWPLAFGEPPTLAESKFHFRVRADSLQTVFGLADELKSLSDLLTHPMRVNSLTTKALTSLLHQSPTGQ
ncbi:MAG: DUF4304 domain-containing protein [Mesorhizobium sp.]|nr:DUF4304 domain-containing protein [Mesorhizobium sp.]MBL8578911.1 DUF4304 domain-containing protein [Mesorhizobium sp.]